MRGESYADFHPDRVAMQDATAQMALLQFMTAGLPEVAVPSTVHCDHLIQAKVGAIDRPRRGHRHQPGGLRLPALGVGEVRHRLLGPRQRDHPPGRARELRLPRRDDDRHRLAHAERRRPRHGRHRRRRRRRRRRDDRLPVQRPLAEGHRRQAHRHAVGLVEPKDVILEVARVLTVEGGTGAIIEYHGPGADSISATGKGTICNMGAEIGATTSLFPYDANMAPVPQGDRPRGDRRRRRQGRRRPAPRRRRVLRPAHRDRPRRAQAADQRPALPRPRPPRRRRQVGARRRRERLAAGDLLGAHRLVHELVVRGHHPGRVDRPPGRRPRGSRRRSSC